MTLGYQPMVTTPETSPPATPEERLALSLDGLSLGDAFGQMFFGSPRSGREVVRKDLLPPGPWWYTDDTEMALAIGEVLRERGEIDHDHLAERFAIRFMAEPDRGYGKGTRTFCVLLDEGVPWRQANTLTFKAGSMGNGSAMRVPPVGAYFAESDFSFIVEQAHKSAEVSHRHPEGLAGAIAVALAAAVAWRQRAATREPAARAIFETILAHTPESETRQGLLKASQLDPASDPEHAARLLGNGTLVTCPDTIPYVVWSACRHLDDFTEAILDTLAGGGDTDTNCAMVGGIVALSAGRGSLPAAWLERREKFKSP